MTDITDQDRRAAMAWAKNWQGDQDGDTSAAARVILATVDALEPTLAEELRDVADNYGMSSRAVDRLDDIADRVERDLAEARAEAKTWREQDENDCGAYMEELASVREALAVEGRRVEKIAQERGEALDKVDRLTAERNRIATGRYVTYAEVDGKAVQKAAESNAETPNPADVKPGEAWVVEVDGERRPAVKDGDGPIPWNTVTDGGRLSPEYSKAVTLITRLVPAPRVITNADDIDRLAVNSVVLDGVKRSCRKASDESWRRCDGMMLGSSQCLSNGPVTVLWEPEA